MIFRLEVDEVSLNFSLKRLRPVPAGQLRGERNPSCQTDGKGDSDRIASGKLGHACLACDFILVTNPLD